jgi:hypothetical protein
MFTVLNSIQVKKIKTKANKCSQKETSEEFDSNKQKFDKFSIYDYLDVQEEINQKNSVILKKTSNHLPTMETIYDVSI